MAEAAPLSVPERRQLKRWFGAYLCCLSLAGPGDFVLLRMGLHPTGTANLLLWAGVFGAGVCTSPLGETIAKRWVKPESDVRREARVARGTAGVIFIVGLLPAMLIHFGLQHKLLDLDGVYSTGVVYDKKLESGVFERGRHWEIYLTYRAGDQVVNTSTQNSRYEVGDSLLIKYSDSYPEVFEIHGKLHPTLYR